MPTPKFVLDNAGVRVVFTWQGDRFVHRLTGGGATLDAAEDPGVETPVFTELHEQDGLLFLSGKSSDRHWSLSVEPVEHGLAFDAAVRASEPVGAIGSVYAFKGGQPPCVIGKPAGDAPPPLIETADGMLRLLAQGVAPETPVTVRYRFEVVAAPTHWLQGDQRSEPLRN